MTGYEYMSLSFTYGEHRQFSCGGVSVLAASPAEARQALQKQLESVAGELRSRWARAQVEEQSAYERAWEAWSAKRDQALANTKVEEVEKEVRKMGRYMVKREQVTLPDGTKRTFEPGKGKAFLDEMVRSAAGAPPAPPETPGDLSDGELVDHLLDSAEEGQVGLWSGSIDPADPLFDSSPMGGDLQARVLAELNRLGRAGWTLTEVSEDRAIFTEPGSPTAARVVAARYTLMRPIAER